MSVRAHLTGLGIHVHQSILARQLALVDGTALFFFPLPSLKAEQWLFNGNDSIDENLRDGFQTQFASQDHNVYGVGIYFAADPRLAMFFQRKTRDEGKDTTKSLILARVTLGNCGVRPPRTPPLYQCRCRHHRPRSR